MIRKEEVNSANGRGSFSNSSLHQIVSVAALDLTSQENELGTKPPTKQFLFHQYVLKKLIQHAPNTSAGLRSGLLKKFIIFKHSNDASQVG